jgi:predicted peptidase
VAAQRFEIREHAGLKFAVLLPTPTRPSALHPVLLFLHGYDEGAPTEIQRALTRHGPLRRGNPADALAPFIIVAPQLPFRGDVWAHFAEPVLSLLRLVHEQHAGDPERSYLTGFSFGANGVFDLAIAQPAHWAALWSVDPTRVPTSDPQLPVWLSFGEIARARKPQFIRRLRLADATESPNGDRAQLDEGADHVGSATLAYADARVYAWLLTKTLRS